MSENSGIPVIAGDIIVVQEYEEYFIFKYLQNLTKVKYSDDISTINKIGNVIDKTVKIPKSSKFIKIYFINDGVYVSKVFDISIKT